MDCVFCKIIKGEIPSYKIFEDDNYLAFLNINPFKEGHSLVVPKKHSDYIFDLPDLELSELMSFCKKIADLLKKTFEPISGKIGVEVIGNEVAHVHVHLIPIESGHDLNPDNAKSATPEELQKTLERINSQKKTGLH